MWTIFVQIVWILNSSFAFHYFLLLLCLLIKAKLINLLIPIRELLGRPSNSSLEDSHHHPRLQPSFFKSQPMVYDTTIETSRIKIRVYAFIKWIYTSEWLVTELKITFRWWELKVSIPPLARTNSLGTASHIQEGAIFLIDLFY